MDNFKDNVLRTKEVSVWGIGYLGYTKVLKLQSKGFRVKVFDITNSGFNNKKRNGSYPDKMMAYRWSKSGSIPSIDFSRFKLAKIEEMFTSEVHILAFPVTYKGGEKRYLDQVSRLFIEYKNKLDNALIIFQSAGPPGTIEHHFIKLLHKNKVHCSIATAFRSDWSIEEFLQEQKKRVLSGKDIKSIQKVKFFYDLLDARYNILKTIKEAEIYENARNGLQYITTVFINQLAAAYQGINIRSMTKYLLENIELNESHLCIGAGGYKMPYFIQSILEGSENPSALSLIQEVHKINLSLIITYADAIKKRGINSVAILGLSVKGNQKSIDFSPSVILAEYFSSVGITVYIDDPLYSKKELLEILPRCQVFDILADKVIVGALFIMNDHNKFKYITQKDINELGLDTIPVIIDNVPLFSNYRFGRSTIYHAIGDGRIGIL